MRNEKRKTSTNREAVFFLAKRKNKLWRFEEEVPHGKESFENLSPGVAKKISSFFELEGTKLPDGTKIVGYRPHGWRRPFVLERGGKKFLASEAAVRKHLAA